MNVMIIFMTVRLDQRSAVVVTMETTDPASMIHHMDTPPNHI